MRAQPPESKLGINLIHFESILINFSYLLLIKFDHVEQF